MSQDAWRQDTSPEPVGEAGDVVDAIIAQWQVERPDLDPQAKHITGRIVRLGALFQQAYAERFASLGLNESDFGVLAPLRRAGAPFQLTPTELARHRMITSGGMTAALDRLERRGYVIRLPNPADRRGHLVQLTDAGRDVIDEAMRLHADAEHLLVSGLDDDEARDLTRLLRTLLAALEPT